VYFLGAVKRQNGAIFQNIFLEMVNLYEIFYVMKVVGKIYLGISFIGRIINFHFRPFLEWVVLKYGLITGSLGSEKFIHKTLAEFFALLYLIKQVNQEEIFKFFVNPYSTNRKSVKRLP
jgi:hypothetical protein